MIYLIIFWGIAIAILCIDYSSTYLKWKKVRSYVERYGLLGSFLLFSLAIMAIITKDPVMLGEYFIPAEFQWLGSLGLSYFVAWKYYFNPLKLKVYHMDREIGEIRSQMSHLTTDMALVKQKLMKFE